MASPNVRMTRRVAFSSGHRYWHPDLSRGDNRALFGPWASPYNHGHNYVLDVTVEGPVLPEEGMVVNIKRIDDILRERIVRQFDGRSINDEIPAFATRAPSIENLLAYIKECLLGDPGEGEDPLFSVSRSPAGSRESVVRLVGLRLEEMPTFYGELDMEEGKLTLTRVYEFAASHRLHSPALSDEENREVYGKCNNPAGHGHNYVLEVTVSGVPDPRTGMLADIGLLDEKVKERVVDRYDHRNLNEEIPEFEGRITTSEVVAQTIFARLADRLPARLDRIRLHETARNVFEVQA